MESALRPRDIQARIRAGESPEEVAAAAQTTVESIMGFATPVLAERAHVAQTAQKASVRRRTNEAAAASARSLGESAELFFGDHHLHDEDVAWDAWRRPDGRWALVARYDLEGRARVAEFSHDVPGRFVVAENDEARVLTGELSRPGTPAASAGAGRRTSTEQGRRLSAVPSQDELPLGDDAIEMVRDPRPASSAAATENTQNTEPVDPAEDVELEPAGDADWIAADEAATVEGAAREDDAVAREAETAAAEEPASEERAARSRRKGRSSVPSWDEIMFGGGRPD